VYIFFMFLYIINFGFPLQASRDIRVDRKVALTVIVLLQGIKIAPLVRPWSTTTMIESQPLFSGKSVVTMLNGCVVVVLIGESGGVVGWVLTFICWHVAQLST
jgi:hypothetical protein